MVKNLLKKSVSYRATLLSWCELSPAELCMGRRLRTSVPQTDTMLIPQWPYLKGLRELDKQKQKQKENFDLRHHVKDVQPILNDTEVWITTDSEPVSGRVVSPESQPRSYEVETQSGIKHKCSQLAVVPRENTETPQEN